MKLDLGLSEKDKKLLVFLAIFVIVVCFVYWGVRPIVKRIIQINEEIADAEDIQTANNRKIAELPLLQTDNEKLEQQIKEARTDYFPMMSSDEVDRYFTDMVLSYQLDSYDLDIQMPETLAELEPYQYSAKYLHLEDEEDEDDDELSEEELLDGVTDDESELLWDDEGEIDHGIYAATVTMRLGGAEEDLNRLIDDLSDSTQKLRVVNYSYTVRQSVQSGADSEYEVLSSKVLNVTIEIYMCEDKEDSEE
jgi:cell division protein FtsB